MVNAIGFLLPQIEKGHLNLDIFNCLCIFTKENNSTGLLFRPMEAGSI